MTTCNNKIAIGSRAQVAFGEEKCYGVAVPPLKRVDFVSESIANNIGQLVSNALNPSRGITNAVRGTSDVGGDIAYEQNTAGMGVFYKHALGDVITMANTDGGIRAQISIGSTAAPTQIVLKTGNLSAAFPKAPSILGEARVVSRDGNGDLVSDIFTYTSIGADGTMYGVAGLGIATRAGDRVFAADTTANMTGVYTHYFEAGVELPTGLTIEVGRDIVFFTYTGCKINQLTENFNAQEFLTGTVSVLGRAEASGADLQNAVVAGDTTAMLKMATYILQDGTGITGYRQRNAAGGMLGTLTHKLQIEGENDITYTGININTNGSAVIFGIPATGTGSITKAHAALMPIAPASTAAESTLTPPTSEPLTSFQAGVYFDGAFSEVLSASYTLNNNLFGDKFQLGDKFRAQLPEQRREVTGSMNLEFDDLVVYRKFVNSTAVELEIRTVDDGAAGQIGSTGVYRQKHHIFPKIKLQGSTPTTGGPDVYTYDVPFQALYDVTDDEPELILIIVNDVQREPHQS